MYNLLFWIAFQLLLLWVLTRLARPYRDKRFFKLLFFPSALLESVFRLIACCFSARNVDVHFFENNKPFLKAGKSRILYYGPVVFLELFGA